MGEEEECSRQLQNEKKRLQQHIQVWSPSAHRPPPPTLLSTPPTFASANHVSLDHESAENSAQSGLSKKDTFLVQIMGNSSMHELQAWLDPGAEVISSGLCRYASPGSICL